jgi:hypothetical protein
VSPDSVEVILYRLDRQDEKLDTMLVQVRETNGRVRSLELWKARMDGAGVVVGKVGPLVTGALGAVIGAVATRLLS